MEFNFLQPVSNELLSFKESLTSQHLGSKILLHTKKGFPNLENINIALIGVLENRDEEGFPNKVDLSQVRKQLYDLFPGNWITQIADLGDILPGNTKEDTYYALQNIVSDLIKKKIIPVIIGGTQDLTYAMYRSYDNLDQMVNLVSVDSKFDFGKENEPVSKNSYLTKIIVDEPNNLFNFSNIGFQTYYNPQEEIDLIEKLYFEALRLGEISQNITIVEPVFRDADLVVLDLSSIKSSDSGNQMHFEPNGFNGKEICALARYAGISDRLTSFGIFNYCHSKNEPTLISQIIWYFIEGVNFRSNEYPFGSKENFSKYIVTSENEDLIFLKSNISNRWWIEVSEFKNNNTKINKNTLLPCSYEDYLTACNNEFPERWWKWQRKRIE